MGLPVWLQRWMLFAFAFYYWGFYIFPSQSAHKTSFYLVVVLPVVAALILAGSAMRTWWRVCFPVILALTYLWLSVLWGDTPSGSMLVQFGKPLLGIFLLFALCAFFRVYGSDDMMRHVWHVILVLSFVGGVILLSRDSVVDQALADRLRGLGAWRNAIQLGYAHGVAVLIATYLWLSGKNTRWSWLYTLPIIMGVSLIILSKSRGPLLALGVTSLWLIARYAGWRYAVISGALVLVLLAGGWLLPGSEGLYSRLMDGSFRTTIWGTVWKSFEHSPLFGIGLHYPLTIVTPEGTFEHSHSLPLEILRFGGIFGLALFLWATCRTVYRAWHLGGEDTRFWVMLLTFGFLCVLTDGKVPLQGPNNYWLILWLPLGILLADITRALSRSGSQTAPRSPD